MKKNRKKTVPICRRTVLAAFLSCVTLSALLYGCSPAKEEAAAVTETGNSTALQEPVVYASADGWELTYQPEWFAIKEENGLVRFTCSLEDTGADYSEIRYVKGKMPREVLYEQIQDAEDSRVTRLEGRFASLTEDWTYTDLIEPAEGGNLREQFDAIEHNGGTILIHSVYRIEKDAEKDELINDTMADTLSTFRFTSHEPQQEFSCVPGTYEHSGKEEIEGKEEPFTDRILLNADHTGMMSFQDDVPLTWSSFELITNDGEERYEYTIEGDRLLVDLDGEWVSFERAK